MLSPGFRIALPATLLVHGSLVWGLVSMPPAQATRVTRVEIEIMISGPLPPSAGGGLGRGQTLRVAAPAPLRAHARGRRRTPGAATPAAPLPNPPSADGRRGPEKNGRERGSDLAHAGGETAVAAPILAAVGPSTSPQYRNHPPPLYPRSSLRRHEQGVALLLVTIGGDGRAIAVSIAKSSGYAALDQAALEAVRDWTFEPALVAGRLTASQALVPVRFALGDR